MKEEEKKIKALTKNLKKQGQLRQVKQELHRTTSRMKLEKSTDFRKPAGLESLVKPAALLELNEDKVSTIKPAVKSVVTKTKPTSVSYTRLSSQFSLFSELILISSVTLFLHLREGVFRNNRFN